MAVGMATVTLTPDEEALLSEDDPELLDEIEAERRRKLRYPKPTQAYVEERFQSLRNEWNGFHEAVQAAEDARYLRDETPQKWARHMEGSRRVRTRLSHNEALRVKASALNNPIRFSVDPAGHSDMARKRARKQARWLNGLFAAFRRYSGKDVVEIAVDSQLGNGLGAWEFYLNGSYDKVNTKYQKVSDSDPETGEPIEREETHREFMDRTESELIQAGLPFGLRFVHPLSLVYDEDDEGVCAAMVAEKMQYRQVYGKIGSQMSAKAFEELKLPQPGDRSWPAIVTNANSANIWGDQNASGMVETLRYYDRRWYMYIVGGILVECVEHKIPRMPIIPLRGVVTSSPNLGEQIQGITWGMLDMELLLNDLLTLGADLAYTFNRPMLAVETQLADNARLMMGADKRPITLDLSDPTKVQQLNPGQRIVDVSKDFKSHFDPQMLQMVLDLWQRNGLNPIAQGESPGADPSGYAVNSFMGAALSLYKGQLENICTAAQEVGDIARLAIRDTIKDRAYTSVPMEDKRKGGTEFLGLGPDDIDETPCKARIDPLSDANRLAIRSSLRQGWMDGVIARERYQGEGYNVEDPEVEDYKILVESGVKRLSGMAVDNAVTRVMTGVTPAQPAASGLVDPQGNPIQSQPGPVPQANGATPAEPQGATVGKDAAAASQTGLSAQGRAGQDSGYRPQPGRASPGEAGR